jgi:hypothetical protein
MAAAIDQAFEGAYWVQLAFQRGLAAIYLIAFVNVLRQFRPLLGEHGLLPVPRYLKHVSFWQAPSIFHLGYSDTRLLAVGWTGVVLACVALSGLSESGPFAMSAAVWLALWLLYQSIVNVGQTFYGFGWESMLLEAGFFAIFLGPESSAPSMIPILALRWMLFRTELGAGLIKLRHDQCWRDLTCLYYHHETQPLPNRLSVYFHRLPKPVLRGGVAFSHFVQIAAPLGLFLPQPIASAAGALIIAHQLILIVSGNYAWLNWLTVVLGLTAFSDDTLAWVLPLSAPALPARPLWHDVILYVLAAVTLALSVQPAINLVRKDQIMNYSFNPLHIVNAYGAFGSVTRERREVILEGSRDGQTWQAYELYGKPGDPAQRPRQVAPYHLRLDWLLWFVPLGAMRHERWLDALVMKLLEGDRAVGKLFRVNPFPDAPPRLVRARLYRYAFASREETRATGVYWKRTLIRDLFEEGQA